MSQTLQWARLWVQKSAEVIAENREFLIDLDRQIGDGDHGENMDRGFTALIRGDGIETAETSADLLRYVARTLLSTVGGAAGPLFGTAFLRASQEIPEGELQPADISELLFAAASGVQTRGKAVAGDKTMVDALLPAAQSAKETAANGADFLETVKAAALAGELGAEATRPMRARKGRASYLGERSCGHVDPGASSTAMILRAAADAAEELFGNESSTNE